MSKRQNEDRIRFVVTAAACPGVRRIQAADGATPLLSASSRKSNPTVITTLPKGDADLRAQEKMIQSLMFAAENNPNPGVITVLPKAGADRKARARGVGAPFNRPYEEYNMKDTRGIRAIVLLCVLLAACVTLPSPQGTQDSLVVGNLLLSPEGSGPRPGHGTYITFTDMSTKSEINVLTSEAGYYYFVAKPGHKYRFDSFGGYETTFPDPPHILGWMFEAEPGKITYLGHITVTFSMTPRRVTSSFTDWDLKASSRLSLDAIQEFTAKPLKDSGWLAYEIVPAKITSMGNE